jgi:hypothetical protein
MTIKILNELSHAEYLLEHGFTRYMYGGDLFILAKYFRYLGMNECEVEDNLVKFCEKFEPSFEMDTGYKTIDWNLKKSKKYGLRVPVDVPITKEELEKIRNLNNYRYEKVLFTLLVLAKYSKLTDGFLGDRRTDEDNSRFYYFNGRFNFILKNAHVSEKKNENIKNILVKSGFIEQTYNGKEYKILFTKVEDINKHEVLINNIDLLITFYPFYCQKCGKIIFKSNNRHKYCFDCWKEKEVARWAESKKKNRKK